MNIRIHWIHVLSDYVRSEFIDTCTLYLWWCHEVATVYPKKNAHGFCFAVLCCGYTLTDFPISIRLTSLALWQSNDCPSASKATLINMDKYFMWIHYERLHSHNKAKHNKPCAYFLGYTVSNQGYSHYAPKHMLKKGNYNKFIELCFRSTIV